MKNKIIVSLVFAVPLLIYFSLLLIQPEKGIEPIANAKDNLPKVIVFSTPMCGECRKISPVIEQAKQNYLGKINITKINAIDNKPETNKLVRTHNVYLVPTIIYIDRNGQVVNRTEGYMTYNEFDGFLKEIMEK